MITDTDKKILDFIIEYYSKTLFYPSFDEVMEGCSIKSKSTVHRHMSKLEREGIIIRKSEKSTQYRVRNMELLRMRK
jgi:SOS-response transcriptional repressor LexA